LTTATPKVKSTVAYIVLS